MTHTSTLCSQCASPATETSGLCWPCSERRRLQATNADLLAALKQCIPWLHSMPLPIGDQHLRDMAAKTLNDAEIAIAHVEAE